MLCLEHRIYVCDRCTILYSFIYYDNNNYACYPSIVRFAKPLRELQSLVGPPGLLRASEAHEALQAAEYTSWPATKITSLERQLHELEKPLTIGQSQTAAMVRPAARDSLSVQIPIVNKLVLSTRAIQVLYDGVQVRVPIRLPYDY